MIENFEDYTEDLSPKDIPLVNLINQFWENRAYNVRFTADKIIEMAETYEIKSDRRKIGLVIKSIRKDISKPYWIAGAYNGYWKTTDINEIEKHKNSLEQRAASHMSQAAFADVKISIIEHGKLPTDSPDLFTLNATT